jgi:hypothetical protein
MRLAVYITGETKMDMSRKKHLATTFAAFAVSVAALIGSDQAVAQKTTPPGAPVNIVSPNPLPVTGTVSGDVSVSGSVSVTNTPNVFVTNTAPNPVPTSVVNPATRPALTSSVDDPGRVAYQASQGLICDEHDCNFTFSAVPAGHRLVIQHISGGFVFNTTPSLIYVSVLSSATPFPGISNFVAPTLGAGSLFDKAILYYVDAGNSPLVDVHTDNFTNFNGINVITLMGYLLDCMVSPCSPIAH